MTEALWPYLIVLLVGMLPNEAFRAAAVLVAKRVDENSEIFVWIRIVAISLLAAVVSKIIYSPPAALAVVPLWVSILGMLTGIAAYFALGRRLILGILAGETVFVLAAWILAGA